MNTTRGRPTSSVDLSATTPSARPRPLLSAALGFMAGIALSENVGSAAPMLAAAAFWAAVCGCLILPALTFRPRTNMVALQALAVLIAVLFGFARHQGATLLPANHVTRLVGDERILTRVAGRVATQPTTTPPEKRNPYLYYDVEPRTRFVLAARELRVGDAPASASGNIRASVEAAEIDAELGDEVVVTGWMYALRGRRNPGETDWARLYRLQNIHTGISVEGAAHVRRESSPRGVGLRATAWLRGRSRSLLFEPLVSDESDQPRRLLDAMVLGRRSAAGRKLNEAFLRTGAIHFLTVSGFHVGVLGGAVWVLIRRVLRRGSRPAAAGSMFVMLLYAVIVEPNAPVMRATVMGVLLCLAQLTRRPFCGVNWLSLAALCVLTFNPLELYRPGFQLSFMQVVAIMTIVPRVYRLLVPRRAEGDVPTDAETWRALVLRRTWRWFAGLAAVCLTAWVVSLPLVLHHFGRFAPWGALQSIIISPLVMVVIVLGFATLSASWAMPPIGAAIGVLLRGSTDGLLWAVDRLGSWPGTLLETQRPPAWLVGVTYCAVLALLWISRRRGARREREHAPPADAGRRTRRRFALIASPLVVVALLWPGWLLAPAWRSRRDCSVHVLSVGSGSAALITAPEGRAMLCDAGTIHNFDAGETVTAAARELGVRRLDLIAVSHANSDHYSGVATATRELDCDELLFNRYLESAAAENAAVARFLNTLPRETPRRRLVAGDELTLGSVTVEVLWPPDDVQHLPANDRSLVLRISAGGRGVLLPGDIERDALQTLVESHEAGRIDLRSDVLIAPHHGAVLPIWTAAFYDAVAPETIINSTGRDRPKLTQMLRDIADEQPIPLLSTHKVGAVTIRITPAGELRIETPFAVEREK